jgi:RHS repeat-associated protein
MSLLTIDPLETAHAYDSGDRRILAKEPTRKASAGVLFMRAGEFDQQDGSSNPMWTRLERNWYKDAKEFKQPSGVKNFMPMFVTSARLRHTPSGDPMLAGELSFSNSITIQRNTLGPGAVGHILRSRTISPTTYTASDRWFAYDQVGSVLAETDANGDVAAVHHSDAWGNRLGDWETGVWGGVRSGWAHNTKEIDPRTDLTYMYQRWYNPETGTFLSRAPFGPDVENEYGFVENNPVGYADPSGEIRFMVESAKGLWRVTSQQGARRALANGENVAVFGRSAGARANSLASSVWGPQNTIRHRWNKHPGTGRPNPHYQHQERGVRGHVYYGSKFDDLLPIAGAGASLIACAISPTYALAATANGLGEGLAHAVHSNVTNPINNRASGKGPIVPTSWGQTWGNAVYDIVDSY